MKNVMVKEVMIPLDEYTTISGEQSLYDAMLVLEDALKAVKATCGEGHRAVLVFDDKGEIVGKLSHLDVLRAMEPKYFEVGDGSPMSLGLSRFGLSPKFMKGLLEQFSLWDKPLKDIAKKTSRIKVKDVMYTPSAGEYVDEEATLDEGVHQLLLGQHQSLLVTRGEGHKVVGILRLGDVFVKAVELIREEKGE
ncbi:CBS domain-containing protein [Desulfobotulus sp. H1]|uniref:CBS domain-containing protein n=1 Tax=Desulfobotulus pelophilus TaxID=2823377 RepID=A0ABT3NBI0_9BACT|nr:CBS domain-containing protein [Desulfobotulus pelophilus]MCW7754819.1 CBS domain-containing protein [Desulfobotulus pelophilus]